MLSLQQISDRLELQQLSIDYATAIDSHDYAGLDRVFVADAYIDYRATGGTDGRLPEIKQWLENALAGFPAHQHLVGNFELRIDGDRASGRVMCLNPIQMRLPDGGLQVAFYGLWYLDTYVRTGQGWRIATRSQQLSFAHNVPGRLSAAS